MCYNTGGPVGLILSARTSHRPACDVERQPPLYNPQRHRVKTACSMWRKKAHGRRIVLLPMTVEDAPQ